ncbi:RNA polymerase [Pseudomonas phage vB_PpuP-Kallioja]
MNAAQNFVKNARKTLRDDSEMESLRAKKGKRNKPVRGGRHEWTPVCTGNQI